MYCIASSCEFSSSSSSCYFRMFFSREYALALLSALTCSTSFLSTVALLLPCGGAQAASSPLAGQTWKRSTSLRILVSVILLLGRIPTVLKIAVTLFPMVSGVKAKPLSLTNKWSFILVGKLRPDVFHKDGHPPVQRLVRGTISAGPWWCVVLCWTTSNVHVLVKMLHKRILQGPGS